MTSSNPRPDTILDLAHQVRPEWKHALDCAAFNHYERLSRVRAYVEQHLDTVDLDATARVACYSKNHFSSYFHRRTGILWSDWLRLTRTTAAAELFCRIDLTVADVAAKVGMSSRSLERAFQRYFGMNASQFRDRVRRHLARERKEWREEEKG